MSLRTGQQCVALLDLPVLRVVRRGDRHVTHDFRVDALLDLEAGTAESLDTDAIARTVHALAAHHALHEPEGFASTIAQHCSTRVPNVQRVTIEVRERGWHRLDIGGRQRDRDLAGSTSEVRVARVVVDEEGTRITSGFRELLLMTPATTGLEPLLLLRLDALWTYGWSEIPFDAQWQQVRRALTEAYAERDHDPGASLASALARAVLDVSPAVFTVDVRLELMRRRAVDMTTFGIDNNGEVFGAYEAARVVHTVTVAREEIAG
jgi:urate oxidase